MSESIVHLSHYIAGEWLAANGQEWTADINPSNATEVLARIPSGDATVVNHAVEAAQAGFERWRTASGPQRAEILHQAANLLARRRQDLATLVALEVGKPIGEALQEVDRGVVILRYFAEEAVHPVGMVIPAQQAYSPEYSTLSSEKGRISVQRS
jgi:alpha-ketoglutaric semialdehyde dehydrogenase